MNVNSLQGYLKKAKRVSKGNINLKVKSEYISYTKILSQGQSEYTIDHLVCTIILFDHCR